MTRGILIAGTESSLAVAIAAEAGKRVEQYAATFIPSRIEPEREKSLLLKAEAQKTEVPKPDLKPESAIAEGGGFIPLNWNPGSPISARSLLLAAENRLGQINEAILVCAPPPIRQQPETITPALIETVINDYIKGWLFLVKEITVLFKNRGAGTLALVLSETNFNIKDEEIDLLGPSVTASFRAFAQSLLAASIGKSYQTLAFSSDLKDDAGFAAYVFKLLEEGNKRYIGKWHKFGHIGIFGR
ncbi:hypothetical protein FACS1894151_04240 [Spirochaetia bacterium]|nr:hypothetical protein FACS1894151_04240 [Spirochaetia bacterium]